MSSLGEKVRRKLPGFAQRKAINDEVIFVKGRVLHSGWGMTGPVTQTIQTDAKLYPLVKLIGDTYAYWCRRCFATIFEQELQLRAMVSNEDGTREYVRSGKVNEQKCPHCLGPIAPLQPGDKVRCHYRFAEDGTWAAWWAERWEW